MINLSSVKKVRNNVQKSEMQIFWNKINNTKKTNLDNNINSQGRIINLKIKKQFNEYLSEIENITDRKIPEIQRAKIKCYIETCEIKKLTLSEYEEHRDKFKDLKKRSHLIKEWELNTNQIWPVYKRAIKSGGTKIRRKGNKYDAHHIIELSYGGENAWWNIHPAKYPDEHQRGIHSKNSYASSFFQ